MSTVSRALVARPARAWLAPLVRHGSTAGYLAHAAATYSIAYPSSRSVHTTGARRDHAGSKHTSKRPTRVKDTKHKHKHKPKHSDRTHRTTSQSRRDRTTAKRVLLSERMQKEARTVLRRIDRDADRAAELQQIPTESVFKRSSATRVKDFLAARSQRKRGSGFGNSAQKTTNDEGKAQSSTSAPSASLAPDSQQTAAAASTRSPPTATQAQPQVTDNPASQMGATQPNTSISGALGRIFAAAKERLAGALLGGQMPTPLTPPPEAESTPAQIEKARQEAEAAAFAALSKTERLESQARIITQAIRRARERGSAEDEETFFHPFPDASAPADFEGQDYIWLSLGPDPENWARNVPPVKDRWLETLSLGLTKSIVVDKEGEEAYEDDFLDSLVDDYDLEDHERLEQLGDSIVNMSARLLAYQNYPDVNEGTLTRLSNYPTQNNILGILFRESGLAQRRHALKNELKQLTQGTAAATTDADSSVDDGPRRPVAEDPHRVTIQKLDDTVDNSITRGLVKKDADVFEAYVAAIFLSHDCDFKLVHDWLSELFRPFQEQAFRFMVQRSESIARLNQAIADRAAASPGLEVADTGGQEQEQHLPPSRNGRFGLKGIYAASMDPTMTFGTVKASYNVPTFKPVAGLGSTGRSGSAQDSGSGFITDEFLTVAARARRLREERLTEEARLRDEEELMKQGWFKRGFLNLRQGFNKLVLGQEEERRSKEEVLAQARTIYGRGSTGREALRIAATEQEKKAAAKKKKAAARVQR
ncbi:uncharacterized protein PFL1_00207 [Pseudozyma flocculosa PF-1]|uniref:RNase III domain-containing protein n=1 Tax=Pseudozyma flocculosa TaxID=84751 RepID=A0A5C3EUA8_9BASI|nr:uncharacterized protein PFL1_00207 [Pseudozyma flocculosa PF-1]EPQ32009.1 hypothetical protein PFL1_00207 [Pseudozyma flocculosa PF-1]SPO35067.1 uncharacterized protein PSFLO_00538 [Pseudozyma flocculosa]